jgi:hypothetical protein
MALEMASLNAEPKPTNGQVFASTRNLAQKVTSGATVNTDQPVFVAVFHGNFIGYRATTLLGEFPVGKVMTVTFDANTLAVTDRGIVPTELDTIGLGAATPLGL